MTLRRPLTPTRLRLGPSRWRKRQCQRVNMKDPKIIKEIWENEFSWWRAPVSDGGVLVSWGLFRKWGNDAAQDQEVDRCGICSDAVVEMWSSWCTGQSTFLPWPLVMSFGYWPKEQDHGFKPPKWVSFVGWQGALIGTGWVRNWGTWEELGVEQLLLCVYI